MLLLRSPFLHGRIGSHDLRSRLRLSTAAIKIRNTLVGGDETLTFSNNASCHELPSQQSLSWYACGPTVYDSSHIGHARTYINTDIIRRILTDHFKIHVNFAMGMTDIDDKIIARSKLEQLADSDPASSQQPPNWLQLARKYEASFLADMDALGVRRPGAILRVTEHMEEIQTYIAGILLTGKAYVTPSGVYFSVPRHSSPPSSSSSQAQQGQGGSSYGKLGAIPSRSVPSSAQLGGDENQENEQEEQENELDKPPLSDKQDPRDFALWKRVQVGEGEGGEGEPWWESPWGPGRPGWHIECSAVTHSHFGSTLDIHSGGIDLRFPHHTNEIAQW